MGRILPSAGNLYFTPVSVTLDWDDPANAALDLYAATGIPLAGTPHLLSKDIYLVLWEGNADPGDLACLEVDSSGSASWKDPNGAACGFDSPPGSGTAYILGIQARG